MKSRLIVLPLLGALAAAWAAVLGAPAAVQAQCGSGSAHCVEYSPEAGSPGTLVTVTPVTPGGLLPVIQSADCAPNARVNADFVKDGVVVAVSRLSGTSNRAQFRVPTTAVGMYRIDLYCPDGNTAGTLEPEFQVLALDTATLTPDVAAPGPSPTIPLAAIYAFAFAVAVFAFSRVKLVTLDRTARFGVRTIRLQDRRSVVRSRRHAMARPLRMRRR
jgi:hypothetical protein